MRTVTDAESKSTPIDILDEVASRPNDEELGTWFFDFDENLLPAEESEARGDATATAGVSEATNEVAASTAAPVDDLDRHDADQPVSEPKPAQADPIDSDVEGVTPILPVSPSAQDVMPPVSPSAPDVTRQTDALSVIPGDESTATRFFEIGLAVTTASALTGLAVFIAVKRRRVARRLKELESATAEGKQGKRASSRRKRRKKGDENAAVFPDIEAQASQDLTIVETWSDESNGSDETEPGDDACVGEGGDEKVPDTESQASEALHPSLTWTDFSGWPEMCLPGW